MMAGNAKSGGGFVFWQDEVRNGGVVGLVAGEAGDGRGVLAKENIGARDRMPFDGVIELVSFVEV
jgi:hypothetical protein